MTPSASPPDASPLALPLKILAGTALLGLLYVGRDVLMPVALALMLGFALAPVVRRLRRLGLSQTPAALAALLLSGAIVAGLGMAVFSQLGTLADNLPRYERHVRDKLATLRALTLDRIAAAQDQAGRLIGEPLAPRAATAHASPADTTAASAARVEGAAHASDDAAGLVAKALALAWGPLGML
ncbi:MAG: AI-2E family transporter, partial [Roseateles sp.]